ncbi:phosphate ABC transporter ATP-binding protein [Ramlibacter rhizophilus]|uniref:Phosphate ABC transporter ATP-binding protein n=1 Tax=Ramlibacter rhizophilus TaxID=1781167 RepID=A0A4Z0BDI8_9BURK|nr:phosphate ABC transporter ATP-binding protein [Ramlibacter rhizophilus]TFY96387.1 phosphate ABC transporter ATP-binding protein [Ramlibacter rhizophilus]
MRVIENEAAALASAGRDVPLVLVSLLAAQVRFGAVTPLVDIDLQVRRGERIALIGANGSGKSTLLRLLHGLVRPTLGRRELHASVRQAMVFQRPFMLRASALNNVALGLWLRGVRWAEARERSAQALERVGLGAVAQRHAPALSGGQQQRLALARAWSLGPELLFLDEPTASLDPHAKREVESLIASFAGAGMTLVFASHNLGQVKRLATRVVYLEQGRILADLPVDRFFDRAFLAAVSHEADLFVKGETA